MHIDEIKNSEDDMNTLNNIVILTILYLILL